jgi:hypothetical protein
LRASYFISPARSGRDCPSIPPACEAARRHGAKAGAGLALCLNPSRRGRGKADPITLVAANDASGQ